MKKVGIILLVVALFLTLTPMVYAKTPTDKFLRGVTNSLTGLLEVPNQIYSVSKENNVLIGCTAGLVKGAAYAAIRTISGIWDVLSFPFAAPSGYEPIFKPDYMFGEYAKSCEKTETPATK